MMVGRVTTHLDLLKALHTLKPKYCTALLKVCRDEEINCLCECIYNVLNGKIPLKDQDKSRLRKYKSILRKLISKGKKTKSRKQIIVQKGGAFLPIVLGSVLSGLLSSFLNK